MFRRIDCFLKTVMLTIKNNSLLKLNQFEIYDGHNYVVVFEDGKSQDGTDSNIEYCICEYCGKERITLLDEDDFLYSIYVKSGDFLRDRRKDERE